MILTVSEAVLYFFIYSFLGWIYETGLVSIREKEWSNRGFLMGPICPIYGVGALVFILIGTGLNIWQTFLLCMVSSAVLEYVTAYVLEKIFHASWWDYSNMPLNINGYICLPASLLFGTAGVIVSHFVQPFLSVPMKYLPGAPEEILSLLLVGIISADLTLTVSSLSDFVSKMKEFEDKINGSIAEKYNELESSISGKWANVKSLSLSESMKELIIEHELSSPNLMLSHLQSRAVKNIRRFRNEGGSSVSRSKIKDTMLRLAEKARTKKN